MTLGNLRLSWLLLWQKLSLHDKRSNSTRTPNPAISQRMADVGSERFFDAIITVLTALRSAMIQSVTSDLIVWA